MLSFHNLTDYVNAMIWLRVVLSKKVTEKIQSAAHESGQFEVKRITLSPAEVSIVLILKEISKIKVTLTNYDTGLPVEVDTKSMQSFLSDIEELTKSLTTRA